MTTFASSREAVAYALSQRKGPRMARLNTSGPAGFRSTWDASAVRACMQAIGVKPDSPEEDELRAWALYNGPKPIKLERDLRRELAEHDLLKPPEPIAKRSDLVHVEWHDPETGEVVETRSIAREGEQ